MPQSCYCLPVGATIVENFTIMGNSLGDVEWSGLIPVITTADNGSVIETGQYGYNNGSWYTGFGAEGKWEGLSQDACPNFREDLEAYLSTAGSNSKSLLVGFATWSLRLALTAAKL